MTAKVEWDSVAADAETATIPQKLLNTVVPLFNELADIEAKFNAATDIEAAVAEVIETATDEESAKLKKQIEQATALIAKHTAVLEENARKAVLANIDPEFDEAKYKARHNDLRNELKDKGKSIQGTFKILGYVESKLSPAGRESDWKGNTPEGELLLKVLDVPKLGTSAGSGTSTKTDPAVAEFNKAAKQWAKDQGMTVADKGALSKEVKEAYTKATGITAP
jgi:ribose 5-phosphate isomerase RpiB